MPLAEPLTLDGSAVIWKVSDDTMYVGFVYDAGLKEPVMRGNSPEGCESRVTAGDPDKAVATAYLVKPEAVGQKSL